MKVAVIVPNYPPTICGVGDHCAHLVQQFLAHGVETHVICSASQTGAKPNGEAIHPVFSDWGNGDLNAVEKLLGEIRPDWVIVQMIAYGYQPKGLPFNVLPLFSRLKKAKLPVLTVFHEVRIRPDGDPRRWAVALLQTQIARRMARLSTRAVTSIDHYFTMLDGAGPAVALIPIGTGIAPVEATPGELAALRAHHNIPPGAPVIATFGNRDIEQYLADFDRLVVDFPGFIWLLCGKTSTSEAVLKSRPYLRNTGKLPADDIYRALRLGDIAFMPEPVSPKMEGGSSNKSTALACALSLGVPVIGVRGNLNNALLRHDENILLVEINRPFALFEALRACLADRVFGEKLGQGALDLYENHLSWPVLGRQFLSQMGHRAEAIAHQKMIHQ